MEKELPCAPLPSPHRWSNYRNVAETLSLCANFLWLLTNPTPTDLPQVNELMDHLSMAFPDYTASAVDQPKPPIRQTTEESSSLKITSLVMEGEPLTNQGFVDLSSLVLLLSSTSSGETSLATSFSIRWDILLLLSFFAGMNHFEINSFGSICSM